MLKMTSQSEKLRVKSEKFRIGSAYDRIYWVRVKSVLNYSLFIFHHSLCRLSF